jgi:hypothetical protein
MIILKLAKNKNELKQSMKKFQVKKGGKIFIFWSGMKLGCLEIKKTFQSGLRRKV